MGVSPDEITPIAEYITREMNANASSPATVRMRDQNRFSSEACIREYQRLPLWRQLFGLGISPQQCVEMQMSNATAALLSWALKVRQNGDWDHKPIIAARFHPRVPRGFQHWHLYGDTLYYYEVWSNVHYGYVGKAAEFSDSVLLDGAGLEQIGSALARFSRPQKDATVSGLRAWDDPHDRAAIQIGMRLYQRYQRGLTAHSVLRAVVSSNQILKKQFLGQRGR